MIDVVRCVSPVDGRIYAEREVASDAAITAALSAAREAQRAWRRLDIARRAAFCSAFVDAMLAMRDEIVPELA